FHSGIAAADNRDFLLTVEEAVTGGTGRHALALELLLGLKPQVHGRGAGGNDQSVAGVFAVVALEPKRAVVQIGFIDGVVHDAGFKTLGVLLHALHELGALNAVVVARPVVYISGGGQLAAHFDTGDQGRVQVGARGINSSGIAGRAGAKNDQSGMSGFAHLCLTEMKYAYSTALCSAPPREQNENRSSEIWQKANMK